VTSLEPPLPVPADDSLDAAASALVDGVATPEEAALVAASPGGAARLAELRAVSEAVGRPGPEQDPSAAASALAAALAAFDAAGTGQATGGDGPDPEQEAHGPDITHGAAPGGGPSETPDRPAPAEMQGLGGATEREKPGLSGLANTAAPDLAAEGEIPGPDSPGSGDDEDGDGREAAGEGRGNVHALAPRRGSPNSVRWLPRLGAVAAALALLVGIAVLTVDLLGRAGDPDAATSGDVAAAPTSAAAGRPGDTGGATAMARAEVSAVIDGGAFGNETAVEAIALRAAAAFDSPPGPAPAGATSLPGDLQRCLEAGPSTVNEEVGAPLYQAKGTFQGIPAVAVAYQRDGDPPRLLLVLARSDCSLLERTSF